MSPPVEENPYDDDALEKMDRIEDPLVMYIIVRKNLNMSPGKLASQVGHGVEYIMLKWHNLLDAPNEPDSSGISLEDFRSVTGTSLWIKQSSSKIIKEAKDKDWEKIKEAVRCFVVKDAGLTEIETGTETVIAVWPMKKSKTPKVIHKLQLLK